MNYWEYIPVMRLNPEPVVLQNVAKRKEKTDSWFSDFQCFIMNKTFNIGKGPSSAFWPHFESLHAKSDGFVLVHELNLNYPLFWIGSLTTEICIRTNVK